MLSDVILPEYFSWEATSTFNPYNEKLSTIGEVTYKVVYNNRDSNYNVLYQDVTFNVIKLKGIISADQTYTYDFDGTNILGKLTNIQTNNTDSYEYKYYVNGKEIFELVHHGVYNVLIVIEETEHYTKATFDIVVTINQAHVTPDKLPTYEAYWNSTLESISLPTNYYWEDEKIVLNEVGTNQKFNAIYDYPVK